MLLKLFLHLLFLFVILVDVESVDELTKCTNEEHICVSVYNCSWAVDQIQQKAPVTTCAFEGRTPKVCCPKNRVTKKVLETTFEHLETEPATVWNETETSLPLAIKDRTASVGQLSQTKCDEYYPYPGYSAGYGGEFSVAMEFPHMALLGYGNENDIQWKCGGSLITLRHVLTAAHCLYSRDSGNVKFVRLGDLDISDDKDDAEPQNFKVKTAIGHPNYDSRTVKNDIAILVLDKLANITKYVKPACLYLTAEIPPNLQMTATGWGITEFGGETSNKLIKLKLKPVSHGDCVEQYKNSGSKSSLNSATQICAGSSTEGKIVDTCEGDSGGPLQYKNFTNQLHYHIIGVTSFGKACGITNSAGVYTRVSHYLPWIESIAFRN